MQARVKATTNIELCYNTQTMEIVGDTVVTGALIQNTQTLEQTLIRVDGFFVAIGHQPNTQLFEGLLDMDQAGYLITQPDSTKTNAAGVFACGDVKDNRFRQAITAAGSGAMAALEAERYLAGLYLIAKQTPVQATLLV